MTARGGIVHSGRATSTRPTASSRTSSPRASNEVVKVKSMATQETNLNEYLKDQGISARETDLRR